MAATSGLCAVTTGGSLAADLLGHILPASGTVATTITVTGPIKLHLHTAASTNTTLGTECADANYSAQPITAWNSITTTAGAGYGVGYVQATSNVGLTFGGGSGMAAAQNLTGVSLQSSDATPVRVAYENYASTVAVPQGNTYTIASGSVSVTLS